MNETEQKLPVAVLVPRNFNDHAVDRIERTFGLVRIGRRLGADGRSAHGARLVAGHRRGLHGRAAQSRDRRQFRRWLRFDRCAPCGGAWRHRHQHAGRADRGGRGHRDRAADQHRSRACHAETGCATAVGRATATILEPADPARPQDLAFSAWAASKQPSHWRAQGAFGLPVAYHNRHRVEGLSYEYMKDIEEGSPQRSTADLGGMR